MRHAEPYRPDPLLQVREAAMTPGEKVLVLLLVALIVGGLLGWITAPYAWVLR